MHVMHIALQRCRERERHARESAVSYAGCMSERDFPERDSFLNTKAS